jgi:hypothetical protein
VTRPVDSHLSARAYAAKERKRREDLARYRHLVRHLAWLRSRDPASADLARAIETVERLALEAIEELS